MVEGARFCMKTGIQFFGFTEIRISENGCSDYRAGESCAGEVQSSEIRSRQVRPAEVCSFEVVQAKSHPAPKSPESFVLVGLFPICNGHVRTTTQICATEVCAAKVCPVHDYDEVPLAEVRRRACCGS